MRERIKHLLVNYKDERNIRREMKENSDYIAGEYRAYQRIIDDLSLILEEQISDFTAAEKLAKAFNISLIHSNDGWCAIITEDIVHNYETEQTIAKEVHGKYWAIADSVPLAIYQVISKLIKDSQKSTM